MRAEAERRAPFFSVLIPTYNRSRLVLRAVRSCLEQTFEDLEVIVVDDGSDDDTAEALAGIRDTRLSYVRQANAGQGAAINNGADHALGRYLALLDSDDLFVPGKLQAMRARIGDREPGCETVFYSQLYFYRGEGNALVKPSRAIARGETVAEYLFCASGIMQTSTLVIPKGLFDRVRYDDAVRRLTDLDLCLRLEAAGGKFEMVAEPLSVWYDAEVGNRASYAMRADQIDAWVRKRSALLTDRTRSGFLARFLAPRIVRSAPRRAVRLLGEAVLRGTISPARAATTLARGAMPHAYGKVRDVIVASRPWSAEPPVR